MPAFPRRRGRLPVLLQAEQAECGLACLAMVLNYHGHRIDLNTLRASHAVSRQGLSLKGLIALADRLQLAGRPLRLEVADLARLKLPALLHWDFNHFVVLAALRRDGIIIHDPALGRRHVGRSAIGKHFTGIALELRPSEAFQPKRREQRLALRDLWTRARGLQRALVQLTLLSLAMQLMALAIPFYAQTVIDDVLVRYDLDLLAVLALGFLLLSLANVAADLIRSFVVLHLGNSLGFQLAVNVKRHLLQLPLGWFGARHLGDIVSRFGSIHKVRDFLTSGLVEAAVDGLMAAGALLLMWLYSTRLALLAVFILLLNTVVKLAFFGWLRRENEALVAATAQENSVFLENLHAIGGIKLFGKEADRSAVWQNAFAQSLNKGIGVQALGICIRVSRALIFGVEHIAVVYLGAREVVAGALSIGMLVAFLSYKEQLYKRFFGLVDKFFDFRLLDVDLCRLADIVHTPTESWPLLAGTPVVESEAPLLELSKLSFRYADDAPPLFSGVDLRVAPGESVAIIGPTGCGKSTLLKVILGLYPPTAGDIRLRGVSTSQLGLARYRAELSGVLQNDALLSGSLLENISFFDPLPDRGRVEACARGAGIAAEIDALPMRYETLVGNMGAALSGGQVQRLLLARALYKKSCLLVLDEATSHLDLETERRVNAAIRELRVARIIVAHRPQSFLFADSVYRLTPMGLVPVDKEALRASLAGNVAGGVGVTGR